LLVGGAALASLLDACVVTPSGPSTAPAVSAGASTRLVMLDAANIDAPDMAPRKQVVTDFMARNPDVTMDWRALPSNIQWDRVARTTLLSGEQVDLVNINGQFIRAWVRDGLLDDLSAHGQLQAAFASVDPSFLAAQSDDAKDSFALPLTHASPAHVTAFFYNKTLLDKAGLQAPKTLDEMRAMVQPLKQLGAVPMVHPSGDVGWNPLLVCWIQPMLVNNQPMDFTLRTLKGEVNYTAPEWIRTFEIIANLTREGVLGAGSGALSVDAAYQLFNQGKAAMLYTGSWSLPALANVSGADLHATGLPLVEHAQKAQPIMAFNGYAIAAASKNKDAAVRWLSYAAEPSVDAQLVDKLQAFSPMPASNVGIKEPIAREVAPWFKDGIVPLDWLWEPEVTTEIQNQVQGLVRGDVQPGAAADAVQATADALRREVAVTTSSVPASVVLATPKPHRPWGEYARNLLWVMPVFAVLAAFLIYPLASGFVLSLRRATGTVQGDFVGPDNYVEAVVGDVVFHQAVANTVVFTIAAILLQTAVGLLIAILIAELRHGRLPYRMIFFAPVVLSSAAVGAVWQWIYAPIFGPLTNLLATFGLAEASSSILATQATALWAIMGAFVWRWAGFNNVIYLAGLQAIPKEYHESAMLEGANGLQRFRHITLPLLLPYTYTVVLLTTMGTLRIFDMMWIMTQGGPAHATETIATYIFTTAFRFQRIGYAQSLAFILLTLTLVLTLVLMATLRKRANQVAG
jgi:raffinose/stachyose/melibiose transport system permease protein